MVICPGFTIKDLPKSLIDNIRSHKCIPFVGSGLSIPFGIPSWPKAIDVLIEECKEQQVHYTLAAGYREEKLLLKAAQAAREKLGPSRYKNCLEKMFLKNVPRKQLKIQALLWRLKPPMIITTNIDTFLENSVKSTPNIVIPTEKARLAEIFRRTEKEQILFKLHGSIKPFSSICFCEDEYEKLYREESYRWAFKSPILENTILFVGFSLTDPYVMEQFKKLREAFCGFEGIHFALIEESDLEKTNEWENIQKIPYRNHTLLPQIFEELVNEAGKPVIPKVMREPRLQRKVTKITLTASENIPKSLSLVRGCCIGDCIILAKGLSGKDKFLGWDHSDIVLIDTPVFFEGTDILVQKHKVMLEKFQKMRTQNLPRYLLTQFRVEPLRSLRSGGLTLYLELGDWALVNSIQLELHYDEKITKMFWESVLLLITKGQSRIFPHHIGNHCIVISKDNKLILNKRRSVDNQMGTISASFEEQLQPPYILQEGVTQFFNGDLTIFDALARGAHEELNIEISKESTKILAFALEANSIAANFLAITKSDLTAEKIYERWHSANDREENLMVPPQITPSWEIESLLPFLATENPIFGGNSIYSGKWHSSSRARILFGLLYDFGYPKVSKYINLNTLNLDRETCTPKE
jgi:hypothetical protein